VTATISVGVTLTTVAALPPIVTVAPALKFAPLMTTRVPPAASPAGGAIASTCSRMRRKSFPVVIDAGVTITAAA